MQIREADSVVNVGFEEAAFGVAVAELVFPRHLDSFAIGRH